MSETGRYLYAIGRGLEEDALSSATGIHDGRLELVRHRGLDAVVSSVSLDEFGEEGLKVNLEHLDWLEDVARHHDDVVHLVAATGAVAPLRLATICLDDEGVKARLDEWYFALEQVLDRVQGRMEWSVKAFSAPAAERFPATSSMNVESGAGAAYLQRRRTATEERRQAESTAVACAEEIYQQLASVSVASRRLRPQDPRLSGHDGTMTLNAAFLVEVDETAGFQAMVQRLQTMNAHVEVMATGPWPPYSFAMLEQR